MLLNSVGDLIYNCFDVDITVYWYVAQFQSNRFGDAQTISYTLEQKLPGVISTFYDDKNNYSFAIATDYDVVQEVKLVRLAASYPIENTGFASGIKTKFIKTSNPLDFEFDEPVTNPKKSPFLFGYDCKKSLYWTRIAQPNFEPIHSKIFGSETLKMEWGTALPYEVVLFNTVNKAPAKSSFSKDVMAFLENGIRSGKIHFKFSIDQVATSSLLDLIIYDTNNPESNKVLLDMDAWVNESLNKMFDFKKAEGPATKGSIHIEIKINRN